MPGPIVIVEASPDTPLVWFDVSIRGGAAADPLGIEGLHRHTALLARRGAGTRDRAALDETLDSLGAALDITVSRDSVTISGLVTIHQFVKLGAHAFVGGSSKVTQDVPPYIKAQGNPVKLYGLNSVGLTRSNFDPAVIRELKRAYRIFFRSDLIVSRAMERAREELQSYPEVEHFLSFVSKSERGLAV